MKEITRIHIAKVAYDIELDAKKDIQKYISALERYADDAELLTDIEIRITELLAERGVASGGVISKDDVAAVRAQLGEPSEFMSDGVGDMAVGIEDIDDVTRKLYRDRDSAILGGVLAGIARFFRIEPIWVRLIFIIILIGSVGTASIVYLILWLIVPPAKTAAEKLQMCGKPVTLESIKQLGEQDDLESPGAVTVRRIVRYGAGVLLLIAAIGALVATVFVAGGLIFGTTDNSPIGSWRPLEAWWLAAAFGLFVLAGLLFSALCFILADATFRIRWSRRIGTSVVAIIAVGMLAFLGGVGTVWYGSWQENVRVNELRKTSTVNLPANFSAVKSLTIESDDPAYGLINIEYIVSDKPRYELNALPGVKPQIAIGDGSTSATVSLQSQGEQARRYWVSGQPSLKIYGPALETVNIKGGAIRYDNATMQENLLVQGETGQFSLNGSYKTVRVTNKDATDMTLGNATIENLEVQLAGGRITAGVVRTLTVQQPDACPAREGRESLGGLEVQAVSSGKVMYNGNERPARFISDNCGWVRVGVKDYNEGRED